VRIRTQELEKRNAEVLRQSEDLRELSNRLLHSQDAERRHIARELHDSVGQILAAISMDLGTVLSQSGKLDSRGARAISESAHLVDQASREIRTISHLLHPPILDLAGLASALRWYVDGFSERSKIKVDLELPSDLVRLPDDTELAVFRIVQECLTNVHRHSGSAAAAVRIQQENSHLMIEVRDYGKGIPRERQMELTASVRTGVGFGGMRERLRHLGGSLEIQSNENGTVIRALLSLDTNDPSPE
jgi:signal transduction histidine kinase